MELMEKISEVDAVRGITLNSQLIDLFDLLGNGEIGDVNNVCDYLTNFLAASSILKNKENMSIYELISNIVNEKVSYLMPNERSKLISFFSEHTMEVRMVWNNSDRLAKLMYKYNVSKYTETVLRLKPCFIRPYNGTLSFLSEKNGDTVKILHNKVLFDRQATYNKVKALFDYLMGTLPNGMPRFNRITVDGQGRFSTVAGMLSNLQEKNAVPENYNLDPLRSAVDFARKYGMDIRLNAMIFFRDYPKRLEASSKEDHKIALCNYGNAIAESFKNCKELTTIDLFNEFIDYAIPFSERSDYWHSKLTIEELCTIASGIKLKMPEVDFGYNDWNYENPHKREKIISLLNKINRFNSEYFPHVKLISHIGMQFHTNTAVSISEINKSIDEMKKFNVPIDVTELDISLNDLTQFEMETIKQKEIMQVFADRVCDGSLRGITAWSVTDEICPERCNGKYASITAYKNKLFSGKTI